ncbi:hypothetical protein QTP86_033222 [Hemibagrus guttatus]|nr:hypothetical protein QTP86_033222 [Hemibagrus guttatus]
MMTSWARLLLLSLCMVTSPLRTKASTIADGTDCSEIKKYSPYALSGVYNIQPSGSKKPFQVYCVMRQDGGWTVIQRRSGGRVSFDRNWKEYKNGFGNVHYDHWLGLAKIWALTKRKRQKSTLRVDLWDFEGNTVYANYQDFRIGSERTAYQLHVGKYTGTAGDAIRGAYTGIDQNGCGFTTNDRDNDGCSPCIFGDIAVNSCSTKEGGGWWFSRCGSANLHGIWHSEGNNRGWASGLHWRTWKSPEPYSAKKTRMMIKTIQ